MFIPYFIGNNTMNKSILIGVSIAITVILLGMYFVSSGTESVDESTLEFNPQDDYEPKSYTASLSESVSIKTP